jgi:hypothetical protein
MSKQEEQLVPAAGSGLRYSTGGVFDSVTMLAEAIRSLGKKHNLVIPGGAIGPDLPLLHAAGISFVFVDPEKETYAIDGGKIGLSKTALDRVAAAAGVRWNPHLCGRTDDGSNPHVVEYQAAGTVLQLDGTERMIHASKRIDLRAEKGTPESTWGSDAQELARIAAKKDRDPWPQILQARQHILSLAESKAKNRAIRSLGVRAGYDAGDIGKGFAVVRLQFTGRSDDPEVEREVSLMIAKRALSSESMLYGGGVRQALAAPTKVPRLAPAEVVEEDEEPEAKPAAPAAAAEPAKPEPAEPASDKGQAVPERKRPADDPLLICGDQVDGKWPRKPCSEFAVEVLKAKIFAAEKKRPEWPARWAAKNEAELLAMKAWLAFKEFDPNQGVLPGVPAPGTSDPDEVEL